MAPSKFTVLHRHLPCVLMLRLGRKYSIGGINLVVPLQTRERAEKIRTKLVRAFTIIQQHTPKLYKRVEKFIPNILVFGVHPPYFATYIADLALCDVSRDYALADSTSPEALATTIVHEGTHGYLESRGVVYSEEKRVQIERICVKAELWLATKIPQADELVAALRQNLQRAPEYWTDVAFSQRQLAELAKTGAPKFLVRYFERKEARRLRSASKGTAVRNANSPAP